MLVGILIIFTILFGVVFRVRDINLIYNEEFYYSEQTSEILTASKLKKNTSTFSVNRNSVDSNIEKAFPYARVSVNFSSMTSIKITLYNRTPLYYFVENEICYILDEDCKVLEVVSIQDYNDKNYQYILLTNVFSASENVLAGQFLDNKYTGVCNDLYKALYSNAMIDEENSEGEWEPKYLEREDMCDIITDIRFGTEYALHGKVDRLIMTTSYGVKLTIIEPQHNLDNKINHAFSALREIVESDRLNGTSLSQSGSINVNYAYDSNNRTITCDYRAD